MRLTVLGAIRIVAMAILTVLIVKALINRSNQGPRQNQDPQQRGIR